MNKTGHQHENKPEAEYLSHFRHKLSTPAMNSMNLDILLVLYIIKFQHELYNIRHSYLFPVPLLSYI